MCCGQNREAARAAAMSGQNRNFAPAAAPTVASATSVIMFEYVGDGEASVRGPVSGQVYRFRQPGDRVRVDPRDRPGLVGVRTLRWVR